MNPTSAADRVDRPDRVAGAVVGSAVGDALGAPFEFGPAGVYTARFPDGVGTMCGAAAAIPARWTEPLHVPLPGYGDRVLRTSGLVDLARRLDGASPLAVPTDFREP
ncbi:ADP-ribosylglycohydrolase family protein [Streptomyces sp. NPDC058322]|uniref:ADP-ribosylglycohydrolase family protein n=1 Tax=unclassified Streptomyces TaxID=2593676 RepID=UPI003445712C